MTFPKVFSFITNPQKTLDVIEKLAIALKLKQRTLVDQSACETIDLGAEVVASALVEDAKKNHGVVLQGIYPEDPAMRLVVEAAGMVRVAVPKLKVPAGFKVFPKRRGRPRAGSPHADTKDRVTTDLVSYFNDRLTEYDFSLTDEGKEYLTKLISEPLGNAEEHTSRIDWWVAAYLHHGSDDLYGDCHIAIFNLGNSIADTLRDLPPDSLVADYIAGIVDTHRRRRFGSKVDEDAVYTVLALQEHVSSLRTPAQQDRGQGTVDMIQFFHWLGESADPKAKPMMCIVSGRTYILFDGKYRFTDVDGRRTIAFNKQNDLRRPFDPKYVRTLSQRFPGTLISLKFYLDRRYLSALTGEAPTYDHSR